MVRPAPSVGQPGRAGGPSVLLAAPMLENPGKFRSALQSALPEFGIWPDGAIGDDTVDVVIIDDHVDLRERRFERLSAVLSLSGGVEHALEASGAFAGAQIYRILTPQHQQLMREYVLYQLLAFQATYDRVRIQQSRRWEWLSPRSPLAGHRALVLGLGFLGEPCARALSNLGLVVTGFSLTGRSLPGIRTIDDLPGLHEALEKTDFLICLLPLTPKTRGLIGRFELALLPAHAVVMNVSRSGCLDEAALIEMLRTNRLAGAILDVFEQEPLPQDHPILDVPNLRITPHCAATPPVEAYIPAVIDALSRLAAGQSPGNAVDPFRGY